MNQIKHNLARVLCAFIVCAMLFGGFGGAIGVLQADALVESVGGSDSLVRTSLKEIKSILTSTMYSDYDELYAQVKDAVSSIGLDLKSYDKELTGATVAFDTLDGEECILVGDDGNLTFKINVAEEARYCLRIEYYTGDITVCDADGNVVSTGKSTSAERMILIDDKVPFKEARSIEFSKAWIDKLPVIGDDGKVVKDNYGNKQTYPSNGDQYLEYVTDQKNNAADSSRPFQKDNNGNELKPDKQLDASWVTAMVQDSTGYYNSPLRFYLSEGEHTITFATVSEPIAIKSISFVPMTPLPTYSEYVEQYKDAPDYTGDKQYIQAEFPTMTSDRTIYQLNDRASAITVPQDPALVLLNAIGGDKWQYTGQWIEWKVNAPAAGMYSIVLRQKQSFYAGMYVSRKVTINGEQPFAEASNLRFNYSESWETKALSASTYDADGNVDYSTSTPLKFYLNEGVNTIRLYVVLGDMAEMLSNVEESLNNINEYYRKILMITGPDADEYRDYDFDKLIPDVLKGLVKEAENLNNASAQLTEVTGAKGDHAATLERIAVILERMGTYPTTIAGSMSTLKDHLGTLGTWLTDSQNQPLLIDYICLQSPSDELPQAEATWWQKFVNELQKFIASFFSDYNSLGSVSDQTLTSEELEKVSITVWTNTSREQAQILRNLVDNDFTAKYNIPIEVKLVVAGTLLPATLAGTGPDISMNAGQSDPVNYAIRSAVKSLNTTTGNTNIGYNFNDLSTWADHPIYGQFIDEIDTFDEVTKRFSESAMTPLTLYGEAYGLPENMSFSMMFYRKDLFVEFGIEVPNTWDDFLSIINTIQSKRLDIGFPTGTGGSMILMYQQNEELYDMGNYDYYLDLFREFYTDEELFEMGYIYEDANGNVIPKTDGMTINLDSDISVGMFKQVCNYFTMYDFPVSYSFANRFRQGTMPLAIADYTNYNTLIVFAPEIQGLWEFTPLPGMVAADGTVDNSTIGAVSSIIMMKSVTDENALAAWTFMQWWTSAEVQSSYGNEMIALLGPSAKQNTANLEALANMSWTKDEYDNLRAQFNAVKCTPEYPGSYIIGRYTNFAFLDVYNNAAEPTEELLSYIVDINNELTRKRSEFGLPTVDTIKELEKMRDEKNKTKD